MDLVTRIYENTSTAEECLRDPCIQFWRLPLSFDRADPQDLNDLLYNFADGADLFNPLLNEADFMDEEQQPPGTAPSTSPQGPE